MTTYKVGCAIVHRGAGPSWTEERVATLRKMWSTHSASKIAKHLGGVTRNAVIGKAHRLGLPKKVEPHPPRHPRDRIRVPRAAGVGR